MSNSQPNAWQTASRNNNRGSNPNSNSSSRTPQNRSTTASPSQQNPSQPPKQPSTAGNVWTQRAAAAAQQQQNSASGSSNGPASLQEDPHTPLNGFNAAEVKTYLAREAVPATYKVQEAQGGQRNSGGAWGSKANHMANGQPFFLQLAKQVATFEGGG